jgi:shikimate kinase
MLTKPASYMILNAENVDDLESLKKSIISLGGVAVLSSEEQKVVKGGVAYSYACNDGSATWLSH